MHEILYKAYCSIWSVFCVLLFSGPTLATSPAWAIDETDDEYFESNVRPVLVEKCGGCHGTGAESPAGGLSITTRESVLVGGDTGPAIVPGDPGGSLLIDAINYQGIYEMPPDSKLTEAEIQILTRWIADGAAWPAYDRPHARISSKTFDLAARRSEHWCWQPVDAVIPPTVKQSDWPLDPLDQFILSRLEEIDLPPADDADRRTWIRRVYFDLIGLPPEPAVIENFIHDQSEDAWSKVVDDLLASPHYGERWARHWMDLVRYAETYGHEFDYPIAHAHQYRDYLIRAFNQDVPYDDFVREHVAGDLLDHPRLNREERFKESILGTGFWFLGEATHGPVDVKADEAGRIDNQIDVLCKTFLGLTVACARCHDHKFDAISAEDYYALSGILQSSRQQIALLDSHDQIDLGRDQALVQVQQAEEVVSSWLARLEQLDSEQTTGQWIGWPPADDSNHADSPTAHLTPEDSIDWESLLRYQQGNTPGHLLNLFGRTERGNDDRIENDLKAARQQLLEQQRQYQLFQKETVLFEDFNDGMPDDWFATGWAFEPQQVPFGFSAAGSMITPVSTIHSGRLGAKFQGVLRSPTFELTHDQILIRIRGHRSTVRLIIDGYQMDVHNPLLFHGCRLEVNNADDFVWMTMAADVRNYCGHRAWLEFIDQGDGYCQIDEIRFAPSNFPGPVGPPSHGAMSVLNHRPGSLDELRSAVAVVVHQFLQQPESLPPLEASQWLGVILEHTRTGKALRAAQTRLMESSAAVPSPGMAIAMTDGSGEDEQLFIRGNPANPGRVVPRSFLTALRPPSETNPQPPVQGSGRLLLANQMAHADNPLTRRVIVNRIWQHLFGEGIVSSVDNFGVLGKRPTHPELLDYLAREFADDGWSIKALIRRLVLSRTYRMASEVSEQGLRVDPANQWLHRARVRRLEGEAIRDSMLMIAGRLDPTLYGAGVPVHLTPFMQGRGRPGTSGPLDGNGRRSIYLAVRRNFLPPMMLTFDTPIPFNTIGRRHQSNIPAQALILMNDPFVIQQAERWAEQIQQYSNDRQARVKRLFEEALGRPPTDSEEQLAFEFLDKQKAAYQQAARPIQDQMRPWQDLCHAMFNLKEFIYIR